MTCVTPIAHCQSDAGPAVLLRDCATGETEWVDLLTGEPLTPEQITNLDCLGIRPNPCDLTPPDQVGWTANGDGSFSKDLGGGFIITGQHVAGTFPTTVSNLPQCQPLSPSPPMLSFSTAGPCSYNVNNPSVIEFTATLPWPRPFGIRVFDIDGTSNTAKHAGPNETVAPSWGIPNSVIGPHASSYRNKGAGQIGAAGAPANGRDFTLIYDAPPAGGPLTFNWHGCCIGFDFAVDCP